MGAFFGPKDWGRLLTAMITPFNKSGEVDLDSTAKVASYLVDVQKNDGLVVSGTTGESPTLTEAEKLAVLKVVIETVGDRAAVLMGTGSYNTAESIELTRKATNAGAHGIMLVNPYYNRPSQAGLETHFKCISAETDLPVMLYNIEPRSAVNLATSTLLKLAEVKNIVAVKEASGNLNQVCDVCAAVPDGFRVYSGDDALTLPMMSVGAHGLVSVSSHIVGDRFKAAIEAFLNGDVAVAAGIQKELTPIVRAIFSAPSPGPVKYALSKRGFDVNRVRLPILTLNETEMKEFDKVVTE